MEMSWIQRHALGVLLRHETARIKDMRPVDVAANLFSYHLDGLIAGQYIVKSARGTYQLTDKGLKLAGSLSTSTIRQTENIKTVIMLYGERDGKILLFRWSRQPYIGKVTLPYGRVALGTTLQSGIENALQDKLGVVAPVAYMSSCLVGIVRDDVQISHMNALVYQVDLSTVTLPYISRNGEAFLANCHTQQDVVDGLIPFIERLVDASEPFDVTWRYE